MFLITTADQRFWKNDEKILFLGEWCKRYDLKNIWSKFDYKVVPYRWDDRQQLYQDYLYLQEVYERYLELLTNHLNALHGETHSLRYWRIIIGPWLNYFIGILFDRYSSLIQVSKAYRITNTWIPESGLWNWVPRDIQQFNEWCRGDEYNQVIYGSIIRHLKLVPYELVNHGVKFRIGSDTNQDHNVQPFNKIFKSFLKSVLSRISELTNPSFVFVESYLRLREQMKLEISLGQIPTLFFRRSIPGAEVRPNIRKALKLDEGNNQFESLLETLIPCQIPLSYVENVARIQEMAHLRYSKKPKVIFTANDYNSNEVFKFWVAGQVEKGAKLVIGQHGGLSGMSLWDAIEEHIINISDQYITWGWSNAGDPKLQPLPAGKLIRIKKRLRPVSKGHILWVWCGLPRYSYWMYSVPVASQFLNYLEDQIDFAKKLSPDVRRLLLLRYYVHDYGWDEVNQMRKLDLGIREYYGKQTMVEQLKQSRLFLGTYNSTTYLEAFAADCPTVLFWNPNHWELMPSAKPYFDELRNAEILHDTPKSAAQKVNEIYRDPEAWWKSSDVQNAKNSFCEQFAHTSANWLRQWKTTLVEIKKEQTTS